MNQRLYSLDVFRGITVAAMILVNNPGDWSNVYSPLLHAPWNGCTPTDLIFPFFLFIVGVSIHFVYSKKINEGLTKDVIIKIVKRSVLIFSVGIFLSLFPKFIFETVRIPGVLQRIAVVYFVTALLYFKADWISQIRVIVVLLVAYYILMTMIPIPDGSETNLEPGSNFSAWIDRFFLEGHLWSQSKTWDPEGILSTIPAIATCILGVLAGRILTSMNDPQKAVAWLFFIGSILIVIGLGWSLTFPLNKSLWTSSYVLYTGGIAFQFLAACYWLIDVHGVRKWSMPFVYYGMNALFVFVMSAILVKILIRIKIGESSLWSLIYEKGYESWLPLKLASFSFAFTLVLLFYFVLRWMYHKKIFIKL